MKKTLKIKNIYFSLLLIYISFILSCASTGDHYIIKKPQNDNYTYENFEVLEVTTGLTKDVVKHDTPNILRQQIIKSINKKTLANSVSTEFNHSSNILQIKPKIYGLNNGNRLIRYLLGTWSSKAKAELDVACAFVEKETQKEIAFGNFVGYIRGGGFGGSPNQKTMSKFVSRQIVDFLQNYKLIYFDKTGFKYYLGLSYDYWGLDSKINDIFDYKGTALFNLGFRSKGPLGLELGILNHFYTELNYHFNDGISDYYRSAYVSAGGLMITGYYEFTVNSFNIKLGITNAIMSMISRDDPSDSDSPELNKEVNPDKIRDFENAYYDIITHGVGISTKINYDYKVGKHFGLSPFLSTRYIIANGKSNLKSEDELSLGGISLSIGLDFYRQKIYKHTKN